MDPKEVQVQVLTDDEQNTSSDYQAVDETADREEEIIPVIVRPGHIRFESLGIIDILIPDIFLDF